MKNKRFGAAFVILGGLLMISLILNICIGSVNVPLKDIPGIFLKTGANETYRDIVLNILFSESTGSSYTWRWSCSVRVSSADIFP